MAAGSISFNPLVVFTSVYESGVYKYKGEKLSVTCEDAFASEVSDHSKKDEDGTLLLPHLSRAAAMSILAENGPFKPQAFAAIVANLPKHPLVTQNLIGRKFRVDQANFFYHEESIIRYRIISSLRSDDDNNAETSTEMKNPFKAALGLKIERADGTPLKDPYLNLHVIVSRL